MDSIVRRLLPPGIHRQRWVGRPLGKGSIIERDVGIARHRRCEGRAAGSNAAAAIRDQLLLRTGARRFESLDFHITAAGQDFVDLQRIVQANGGITSSNQLPVFSNISEGLGIFASRSKLDIEGITLASSGIDSLVNGIYTKDLSFIE